MVAGAGSARRRAAPNERNYLALGRAGPDLR